MTTDNRLVLARSHEQQRFWKILAGAVGGSLLLHAIAAVVFNLLPQTVPDNSVEVTLVDSSELPPDFPASPTPPVKVSLTSTPSVKITSTPTPTPSIKITPTPTPTPSVKITPTPTSTPSVKITPTPTPTPSVKIAPTPTPTPLVKIKPDPVPVKIIIRPSKSLLPPTQQVVSKPSPSIIAVSPSSVAQVNENRITENSQDLQPPVNDAAAPSDSLTVEQPALNSNLDSPSPLDLGEPNQPGLTNPNSMALSPDTGGLDERNGDSSSLVTTAPDGGLDNFLAGGGTNLNNPFPSVVALDQGKPHSLGKPDGIPGTTPGNSSLGGSKSPLLPGAGNSNSSSGVSSEKPSIASPSSLIGGLRGQEVQQYFGELACLKNCRPVYRGVVTEFRQVRVNIILSAQGRVIKARITESSDNPRFDNYAEARFKEMLFQLPTGAQRDFIVTMEFKPK